MGCRGHIVVTCEHNIHAAAGRIEHCARAKNTSWVALFELRNPWPPLEGAGRRSTPERRLALRGGNEVIRVINPPHRNTVVRAVPRPMPEWIVLTVAAFAIGVPSPG